MLVSTPSQKLVVHGFEDGQSSPPRVTPLMHQGNNKKAPMKDIFNSTNCALLALRPSRPWYHCSLCSLRSHALAAPPMTTYKATITRFHYSKPVIGVHSLYLPLYWNVAQSFQFKYIGIAVPDGASIGGASMCFASYSYSCKWSPVYTYV